jgi:hypothetical protein
VSLRFRDYNTAEENFRAVTKAQPRNYEAKKRIKDIDELFVALAEAAKLQKEAEEMQRKAEEQQKKMELELQKMQEAERKAGTAPATTPPAGGEGTTTPPAGGGATTPPSSSAPPPAASKNGTAAK